MTDRKPSVLFLCSANSCRSQMAEALLRRHAGDLFEVYSAGLEPAAQIHPLARQVMAEAGLPLEGQYPKGVDKYLGRVRIDHVIIVCDKAADKCPTIWPGVTERLVWPFEDPPAFKGSPEETLVKFRQIRDQIEETIRSWAKAPREGRRQQPG